MVDKNPLFYSHKITRVDSWVSGMGAVKRKLIWPKCVIQCCAFSVLLSSKRISVSIYVSVCLAVTRENKGKPFELSSEYEIKTLILKVCANLDCLDPGRCTEKYRLSAGTLDPEVLALSLPLSACQWANQSLNFDNKYRQPIDHSWFC